MTSCPISLCGGMLCCIVFKMALCHHYPCPEEIDVFSGPHMRMKQLVYEALEKVRSINCNEGTLIFGNFCERMNTRPEVF